MKATHVMIDAKDHYSYGLIAEVIREDYVAHGEETVLRYHVLVRGYDNCIKAGFVPKFIKFHQLDINGFRFAILASKCRVLSNDEVRAVMQQRKEIKTNPKPQPQPNVDDIKSIIYKLSMLPDDADELERAGVYAKKACEMLDEYVRFYQRKE